ncbi:MAG: hypothetical protein EA422_10400 [Gemmatimonadales bacterium]|nr:MAG: hypothetical protein EA422_10400 [Gemmatimonadales bacterium]
MKPAYQHPRSRIPVRPREGGDVPGIVIADGGEAARLSEQLPRVRAFVYGERIPSAPTLPFGRWKLPA